MPVLLFGESIRGIRTHLKSSRVAKIYVRSVTANLLRTYVNYIQFNFIKDKNNNGHHDGVLILAQRCCQLGSVQESPSRSVSFYRGIKNGVLLRPPILQWGCKKNSMPSVRYSVLVSIVWICTCGSKSLIRTSVWHGIQYRHYLSLLLVVSTENNGMY